MAKTPPQNLFIYLFIFQVFRTCLHSAKLICCFMMTLGYPVFISRSVFQRFLSLNTGLREDTLAYNWMQSRCSTSKPPLLDVLMIFGYWTLDLPTPQQITPCPPLMPFVTLAHNSSKVCESPWGSYNNIFFTWSLSPCEGSE